MRCIYHGGRGPDCRALPVLPSLAALEIKKLCFKEDIIVAI
jgi:hypothetical protein